MCASELSVALHDPLDEVFRLSTQPNPQHGPQKRLQACPSLVLFVNSLF